MEEFIKSFVKIEFIESANAYGLYPFQLLAIKDGKNEINALAVASIQDVISRVKKYLFSGYDVFVALDFPAGKDIENDFILSLHIVGGDILSLMVTEYNSEDGSIIGNANGNQYGLAKEIANYFVN